VLTALILICSVGISGDLGERTRENATTEIRMPSEFANPILCLMQSFGQELNFSDRVKIICIREAATVAVDKSPNR